MVTGELIVQAGAIIGGLTVIGSAVWRWVVRPAFVNSVTEVVRVELKPVRDELSLNSGSSVKDAVYRIEARLDDHLRLHEGH